MALLFSKTDLKLINHQDRLFWYQDLVCVLFDHHHHHRHQSLDQFIKLIQVDSQKHFDVQFKGQGRQCCAERCSST